MIKSYPIRWFFCDELFSILWKYFEKRIFWSQVAYYLQKKKFNKNEFLFLISSKIPVITYNMKGCLRFSIFIFWILPNLSKYTYGWSSLDEHHKIENWSNPLLMPLRSFIFYILGVLEGWFDGQIGGLI
jgi:hypothetical protein